LAALCRFYPGYTLESLRQVSVREFRVLVDVMNQAFEEG
jgi:hypothetical protein